MAARTTSRFVVEVCGYVLEGMPFRDNVGQDRTTSRFVIEVCGYALEGMPFRDNDGQDPIAVAGEICGCILEGKPNLADDGQDEIAVATDTDAGHRRQACRFRTSSWEPVALRHTRRWNLLCTCSARTRWNNPWGALARTHAPEFACSSWEPWASQGPAQRAAATGRWRRRKSPSLSLRRRSHDRRRRAAPRNSRSGRRCRG